MGIAKDNRDLAILRLRMAGKTYRECGAQFGITGSRARQICVREGFKNALNIAQYMAEHGDPKPKIEETVKIYVEAGFMHDSFLRSIVDNALKKAGR